MCKDKNQFGVVILDKAIEFNQTTGEFVKMLMSINMPMGMSNLVSDGYEFATEVTTNDD